MKSKARQDMAEKAAKRIERLQERRQQEREPTGKTGAEALSAMMGLEVVELPKKEEKPKIVLYLREGVNPAEKNFTKYPNDIHPLMKKLLTEKRPKGPKQRLVEVTETAEGNLYMYLWWLSWGYGKNYCRVSHGKMSRDSLVGSKRNAQRAVDTLAAKHFIVRALQKNGEANVDQDGHLYRIITPEELRNGKTSEGVELDAIPAEGVVMVTMDAVTIPQNPDDNSDSKDIDTVTIRHNGHSHPGYSQDGHSQGDYTGMDTAAIDTVTTPPVETDGEKAGDGYGQGDHSQGVHPLKEDYLKDSLSEDPVKLFYTGIGQKRVSKVRREKGNFILQDLQKEGFSPEEIQFAIEWTLTPGNTKEKVHDFSIISHTIGQALSARSADEVAAESAWKEAARVRAAEEEEKRLEGEIEGLRSKLSEVKLADLRKRAEKEIAQMDDIKKEFINEPLITAKENEILRRNNQ